MANGFKPSIIALALTLSVAGCTPTPRSCELNQVATGASIGAGIGAALGVIGAAAGHAGAGPGLAIAAGAAVTGAAIGVIAGLHQDEVCHQMALDQALDQATAAQRYERWARTSQLQSTWRGGQNSLEQQSEYQQPMQPQYWPPQSMQPQYWPAQPMWPPQLPPASSNSMESQRYAPVAAPQQVAEPPAPGAAPPAGRVYQTVAWSDPATKRVGAITPLSNVTESAADKVCMTYSDLQITGGNQQATTSKACRGADGSWTPVP